MAYNWDADSGVADLKKHNQGWSTEDAVNWGKRYYGWTDSGPSSAQTQPGQTYVAPDLAPANAGTVQQQSANAQTYSQTPGATPSDYTTNQGTQDVVRNSYLQQAVQPTTVDKTSPEYRQQADTFAANTERAKRNYLGDLAEGTSAAATGALRGETRMANERAGVMNANFESELVGRELAQIRNEKKESLEALSMFMSDDQKALLQRDIADLEAQLKREGYDVESSLGFAKLGQDDDHFKKNQALSWSQFDWTTSPMNPNNWPD